MLDVTVKFVFWQAAGAVGGALAIMEYMPPKYKHMLGGPSLQVDLHTGAIAEGLLTFLITFAVLVIMLKGPQSNILKTWLVAVATVVLIVTGSAYTGPSMNPANVSRFHLSLHLFQLKKKKKKHPNCFSNLLKSIYCCDALIVPLSNNYAIRYGFYFIFAV